jgi:hypothetical protein
MKKLRIVSGILGIFLPPFIGMSFEISEGMLLRWICLFFFGIIAKVLLQTFEKPFMNISTNTQVPDHHIRNLNFISSFTFFLGLGLLVGEILFFANIGVLPISLLILGVSIHLGTNYINLNKWYFNE